jgi:hypothetical protein
MSEDGEQTLQHLPEPRGMAGERLADALEGVLRRHGSVEGCAASLEHPRLLRPPAVAASRTRSVS